jgi:site-specific DNA recombinase
VNGTAAVSGHTPEHFDDSVEAVLAAPEDPATAARRIHAEDRVAECDGRLLRYREALDAGVDEVVVGGWIADVLAENARAEEILTDYTTDQPTEADIRAMAAWFSECADRFDATLNRIDPERRKALYQAIGLRPIVTPGTDQVEVTLRADRGGNMVPEVRKAPPLHLKATFRIGPNTRNS